MIHVAIDDGSNNDDDIMDTIATAKIPSMVSPPLSIKSTSGNLHSF